MSDLSVRANESFVTAFGASPEILAQAPGRVNLIGEHTDYNDGFVLPCAIDLGTLAAARRRSDRQVRVVSSDFGTEIEAFDLDLPYAACLAHPWVDYIRAVCAALAAEGHRLQGLDLALAGDLPQGAGLSSSASLEVVVATVLAAVADLRIDRPTLARIAQRAENDFVGCRCGIMDQLASAMGRAGHALLIDCRSLDVRPIAMGENVAVTIIHSGVSRGLVDGAYNERRASCEAAAQALGVPALRDASLDQLEQAAGRLEPTTFRRARHVITENARTLAAAECLERGDLAALGALMGQSHASMRDDFEITTPAIDQLVALIADTIGDRGGVRMTGGGFGGAVVAVTDRLTADQVRTAAISAYRTPDGEPPLVITATPADGVHRL